MSAEPFRIDVLTLFPEFFSGPLETGLVGRAFRAGRAELGLIDPRTFTTDRHRTVDAPPYGGGAGMVMKIEPLARGLEVVRSRGTGPILLLTPRGRPLRQVDLHRYAEGAHLGLVCGRYEGFDERVSTLVDEEVSLGDFVLTGGEYAALTLIDGVVRLLPGTLGNPASAPSDSFSSGWLEHPQYTRPEVFRGLAVPDVLQSGHHARIEQWRCRQQVEVTASRRSDLLPGLRWPGPARFDAEVPARDLRLAVSAPGRSLDGLAQLALAYQVPVYVVGAAAEDVAGLEDIEVPAWPRPRRLRAGRTVRVPVSEALQVVASWSALDALLGEETIRVGVDGRWPAPAGPTRSPPEVLAEARAATVCLGLGAPEGWAGSALPAVRQRVEAASLDLELQAAVLLDRVLGEV